MDENNLKELKKAPLKVLVVVKKGEWVKAPYQQIYPLIVGKC